MALAAFSNTCTVNIVEPKRIRVTAGAVRNDANTATRTLAAATDIYIDATAGAAGALDTGSITASTWYAVYLIYGASPGVSVILSASQTGPTLPGGYTDWCFVDLVYVGADSQFSAGGNLEDAIGRPATLARSVGKLWAADAAGDNADTVTVADAGGDTTTWPLLATAQTGNLGPATDAGLTYNATTNVLTAGGFAGALTGNVTGDVTGSASGNLSKTVPGEIAALGAVTVASGDLLVVEDVSDSNAKGKVTAGAIADLASGTLPAGYIYGLEVNYSTAARVTVEAGRCRDTGNSGNIVLAAQVTVDITASGELGKGSAAAEAADTWYFVWVWAKADGTSTATLDTSASSPTDPLGGATYVYKRLVGAVRNNNGSDFVPFTCSSKGPLRRFLYSNAAAPLEIRDNAITNAWRSYDCSPAVPTIATVLMAIGLLNQGGTEQEIFAIPNGVAEADANWHWIGRASVNQLLGSYFEMQVGTSQIIRAKTSTTTVTTFAFVIRGWEFHA